MTAPIHIALLVLSAVVLSHGSASSCTDETCSVLERVSSTIETIAKDLANDSALEQAAEHTMTLLQIQTSIQNESGVINMSRWHHNSSTPFHKKLTVSLLDNSPLCPDGLEGILSVTATVGTFSLILAVVMTVTSVWYLIFCPSGESTEPLKKNVEADKHSSTHEASMSSTHEGPIWLNRLSLIGGCLIMINYTVVMPGSVEVAEEHGASQAFSGFIIGIYSIGSCVSVPFMYYLSKTSYPLAYMAVGVAGTVGNTLYAFSAWINWGPMLLLARFICGLEGGAIVVFGSSLQKCNGVALVPMLNARLTVAGSSGLILGPTISSLVRSIFPDISPEVLPAAVMAVCTGAYFILVLIKAPSHEECMVGVDTGAQSANEQTSPQFIGASYLTLCLSVIFQMSRFFQRVFWESALLVVLSEEYGYGDVASGYQLSLALLPLLLVPFFARFYASLGFCKFIYVTEAMQFAGLVLMIRIGEPSTFSFLILIIGSGLFNFANWVQNVAYSIITKRFDVPDHWLLCIDGRVSLAYGFTFFGYFFGPVLSRSMTEVCLWQNLLPYGLFLMFAQMVFSHLQVTCILKDYVNKM